MNETDLEIQDSLTYEVSPGSCFKNFSVEEHNRFLALDDGWSGDPFSFLHFSTFSGVSKQRAFALTKNWLSEAMLATQKLLVPNAAGIPGGVQTDRWYRPKILMSIDFVRKVRWCDLKCPLILLLGVNIKVNAPDPVRCIEKHCF
jgi:hypothetical protein